MVFWLLVVEGRRIYPPDHALKNPNPGFLPTTKIFAIVNITT